METKKYILVILKEEGEAEEIFRKEFTENEKGYAITAYQAACKALESAQCYLESQSEQNSATGEIDYHTEYYNACFIHVHLVSEKINH